MKGAFATPCIYQISNSSGKCELNFATMMMMIVLNSRFLLW